MPMTIIVVIMYIELSSRRVDLCDKSLKDVIPSSV